MPELSIEVDQDLCIGSGECVAIAPLAFELGPDDSTVRVLPTGTTIDGDLLRDAEMSCPTGAIQIAAPS